MLARSFVIESSSKMLGTRTSINARSSSILGRIRPLILELLALEWRKFHTFELEYLWSQLDNLDQILYVASLGRGKGCISFEADWIKTLVFHGNRNPPLTYNGENDGFTFSRLFLIQSFLYFQVTRTCIQSRTSSNFGKIGPVTTELAALEVKKNSYRLIMGKWCLHASSFIFDRIIIKVAGNQDKRKSSDKFDFGPLVSMAHLYVFWNAIWPWHIGLRWAIVALWATFFFLYPDRTIFFPVLTDSDPFV